MAFDLIRGSTSPANWSRGNDVGSVGIEPKSLVPSNRSLVYGAAAGAALVGGFLLLRGRARKKSPAFAPLARQTMIATRSPGGFYMGPMVDYYRKR